MILDIFMMFLGIFQGYYSNEATICLFGRGNNLLPRVVIDAAYTSLRGDKLSPRYSYSSVYISYEVEN